MHLIIFILMTLSCFACSEPPQCVPGRVLACPCPPSGQGIQRCAEDGSRFLACECGHLDPPITSLDRQQSFLNMGDKSFSTSSSADLNTEQSNSVHEAKAVEEHSQVKSEINVDPEKTIFSLVNKAESEKKEESPFQKASLETTSNTQMALVEKANKQSKIMALSAVIEDASATESNEIATSPSKSEKNEVITATKQFSLNLRNQKQDWWFYSETLERCVPAKNVNGIDYEPLKLLSDGCYRLNGKGNMVVRCDDPPLGPQTYRFSEEERDCIALRSQQIKQQSKQAQIKRSLKISALEPVIEGQASSNTTSTSNTTSPLNDIEASRTWHCMCYEEVVKGEVKLSTACRPSLAMCKDLTEKVKIGSAILVKNSVSAPCQTRKASAPWRAFTGKGSRRYFWQPSSQPGAWWSAEGCFLDSKVRSKRAKRKSSQQSKRLKSNSSSPVKNAEHEDDIPPELLRPIGTKRSLLKYGKRGTAPRAERCEESCQANLVPKQQLKGLYGTSEVPPLLRWGKNFAERVKLVKTICMSNQGKSKRGRDACLKKVISKCTKYCERSGD